MITQFSTDHHFYLTDFYNSFEKSVSRIFEFNIQILVGFNNF